MNESSVVAWLGYGCLVAISSWTGLQASRMLDWKEEALRVRIPLAFGLALAPFLAGFAVMLPMTFLRGASHGSHVAVACGLLVVSGLLAKGLGLPQGKTLAGFKAGVGVYLLGGYLLLWLLMLAVNAVFLPLLQNDALEYATVGRILFESRDLLSYPAIQPETTSSGFYGPWTHPPLYVALIYLSYIIQGHAHEPGLMRLIAPWFLVTAVYALIALGRLASRQIGLLSGILFISTPILFLGADSALIDALPVSGMVLLLVALVGLQAKQPRYSLTVGAVVGVVLWTHSQAILFIPLMVAGLFIQGGLWKWRLTFVSVAWATGAALLVGGGYYLKNYFLWGSLISDNPAVLAIDASGWQTYFSYARGLDHFFAKMQYGLFKGWVCFEAYGPLFWLGIGGLTAFLYSLPKANLKEVVFQGAAPEAGFLQLQWFCFVSFATYFLGTAASMLIGSDLMIKNERYLLVMAPAMSIFGSLLVEKGARVAWRKITSSKRETVMKDLSFLSLVAATVVGLIIWFGVSVYYRWQYLPLFFYSEKNTQETLISSKKFLWFHHILSFYPNTALAQAYAQTFSQGKLILGLRPADLFYSGQKMKSYLDPSLIAFYLKKDFEEAIEELKMQKILYVQMPDYLFPNVSRTSLHQILADPRHSELVYHNHGYQIYKIAQQERQFTDILDLSPGQVPWTKTCRLRWGGKKALGIFHFFVRPHFGGKSSARFPFFCRDYSTLLATGVGGGLGYNSKMELPRISGDSEYRLLLKIKGNGYVTVWIQEFGEHGNPPAAKSALQGKPVRLGDLVLAPGQSEENFRRRFRTLSSTSYVRIGVEHHGMSFVQVDKVALEKIASSSSVPP